MDRDSTLYIKQARHLAAQCWRWLWWHAWFPFAAVVATVVSVADATLGPNGLTIRTAGVALGDMDLSLRSKRCTYGPGLAVVTRLVPICPRGCRGCLRGKIGHLATSAFTVRGDVDCHFAWEAWHWRPSWRIHRDEK